MTPPSFLSARDCVLQALGKSLECELKAGEQLYLPCGWFHEVRSYGECAEGGHLALNYWFHPPDNLDPSPQGMQKPYRWEVTCDKCTGSSTGVIERHFLSRVETSA